MMHFLRWPQYTSSPHILIYFRWCLNLLFLNMSVDFVIGRQYSGGKKQYLFSQPTFCTCMTDIFAMWYFCLHKSRIPYNEDRYQPSLLCGRSCQLGLVRTVRDLARLCLYSSTETNILASCNHFICTTGLYCTPHPFFSLPTLSNSLLLWVS